MSNNQDSFPMDPRSRDRRFVARIPVFMYATDFREEALEHVIESLDPVPFERVTGLTIADFKTLSDLGLFNTASGGQPSSPDDAEVLGRRAAMVVLAGGAWERSLGELLTSAEARVLLGGISREALRKRVLSGSVLALRDDADLIRYPRWQFDATNSAPFVAIKKVNGIFVEAGLDPWTLAAFATAPQPELDDRTPVEAFADADLEPLLLAARRTVADLTR